MSRDAGPFAEALMRHGYTREEARQAVTLIVEGEAIRHPSYPCTVGMMLGPRHCKITADVDEHDKLVLKVLAFL